MSKKLAYSIVLVISLVFLFAGAYKTYAIGVDTGCAACEETTPSRPDYDRPDEPDEPRASCVISASPKTVYPGDTVTLKWSTYSARTASIGGLGRVKTGIDRTKEVKVNKTTKYRMYVKNSTYSGTCATKVTVVTPPAQPSCRFSVNPSSAKPGDIISLVWETSNADEVKITDISNSLSLDGSLNIYAPSESTTYELIAKNKAGDTVVCKADLDVAPKVYPPSCTLRSIPSSVPYGGSATLVWTSAYASSANISDIGNVNVAGSKIVQGLTSGKSYVMTVTGPGGTNVCNATVEVESYPPSALNCNISANPNPAKNNSTVLRWTSNGATWAKLSGVNAGLYVSPSGYKNITELPEGNYNYTLTVGNNYATKTCSVTVTNQVDSGAPACYLRADKTNINVGEAVRLSWSSTNATSASFAGSGLVSLNGSKYVYPSTSGAYKLIVTDSSGRQNSCSAYVTVQGATVINVSSIPYTGPNDALYVGLMGVISMISFAVLYRRRHHLKSIFK